MTASRRWITPGAAFLIGTAALGACAGDGPAVAADPVAYAEQIVEQTNNARVARGLRELTGSQCAREAALGRAADLVGVAELVHADLSPVYRSCSPPGGMTAENLSRTADTPAAVVEAWLASPGHANNLLSPDVTEIGVGCVVDDTFGDEQMLCSQMFLG